LCAWGRVDSPCEATSPQLPSQSEAPASPPTGLPLWAIFRLQDTRGKSLLLRSVCQQTELSGVVGKFQHLPELNSPPRTLCMCAWGRVDSPCEATSPQLLRPALAATPSLLCALTPLASGGCASSLRDNARPQPQARLLPQARRPCRA